MDQNKDNSRNNKPGNDKKSKGNIWVSLIIAVAIVVLIGTLYNVIAGSQYLMKKLNDKKKEVK